MKHILTPTLFITCLVGKLFGQQPDSLFTGLVFTPQEELDKIQEAPMVFGGGELPNSVDLSADMPPAGNQGRQNSCVAWSVGYAVKSYYEHKEEKTQYVVNDQKNIAAVFSPSYIYNQIQLPGGGGSLFKDALDLLYDQGAAKWSDFPYNEFNSSNQPSQAVKNNAATYKIDKWNWISPRGIENIRSNLNSGNPVIIGATVDHDFQQRGYWAHQNNQDFIWTQKATFNGSGHAMTVVGYDDTKAAFKVLNSWGDDWGTEGYCWISYGLFPMVVSEAYIIKDHENNQSTIPHVVLDTDTKHDQDGNSDFDIPFAITNCAFLPASWQIPVSSMRIDGIFQVPAQSGKSYEVVVRFYHDNTPFAGSGHHEKGTPVKSENPWFSMPDGSLAVSTGESPINNNFTMGFNVPWWCGITLDQFATSAEKTNMFIERHYYIAEAVLYVDNYPVKTSMQIPFFVDF